jgi:general secretion pathway protein G
MKRFRLLAQRREAGLTLLEIMVVVVIMGMIAGIVAKVVVDRIEMARVETAKTQIAEIAGALDLFYLDNSFYPATEQTLQALVIKPTAGRIPEKWHQYMPSVPLDPWGHEYIYISPGSHSPNYDIICLGRDGVEGGEGFDADIGSWELGGRKGQ